MQPFSGAIPGAPGASLKKMIKKRPYNNSIANPGATGSTGVRGVSIKTRKRPYKTSKKPAHSKTDSLKNRREKKKKNRQNVQSHPVTPIQKSSQIKKAETKELKRHLYIFKSLTRKAKNRDIVLKKAPLSLYKTIRLLFKLLKKGAIPLNNPQRNRLKPWVNFIRENSTGSDSSVKKRISQRGEGLGSVLKTVLPIIGPILSMIV